MSIKDKWPDIYNQLLKARDILENYYCDVCDFEFTVEKGKLFILRACIGRRSLKADIVFAIQFFQEGKIDIGEAIARFSPEGIEKIIEPEITNKSTLSFLGRGISASPGAATGKIALSADSAESLAKSGDEVILLLHELSPSDLHGMFASKGILTARGGKTSHAAVVSRGIEKPCVSGFDLMDFDYARNQVAFSNSLIFNEGDWITINGSDGSVYGGKGDVLLKHWSKYPELVFVNQMIECAIITNKMQHNNVGNAWRIRDLFIHCVPISSKYSFKRAIKRKDYKSFIPPKKTLLNKLRKDLIKIPLSDRFNYNFIMNGLHNALYRILSTSLGIGNHPLFFRPLWDPEHQIKQKGESFTQFVGFEYFDINRYIPNLIDFSYIRFLMEIDLSSKEEGWFLDFTNPNGESIVGNSLSLKSYCLIVNGAIVNHSDLPIFYNYIRKREYYWQWFETKKIAREEIIAFLTKQYEGKQNSNHILNLYSAELGLLGNGQLTDTGLSLIGKRKWSKGL